MSSEKGKSGKSKKGYKAEIDTALALHIGSNPPGSAAAGTPATGGATPKGNGKDTSSGEHTDPTPTGPIPLPLDSILSSSASGRRKTLTSFKDGEGSGRRESDSGPVGSSSARLSTRSSVRLMVDKDGKPKEKDHHKDKEKEHKDKKEKKKDKEHKDKDKEHKDKDKDHKDKEKDHKDKEKDHKDHKEHKEKDRELSRGVSHMALDGVDSDGKHQKSPRKPRRSASVANLKKGTQITRDSSSVSIMSTPTAITSPKVLRMDDAPVYRATDDATHTTTSSESTDGTDDSLVTTRLPSSPNGMVSPLRSSDTLNKRHSEVSRRKSARTLNTKARISKVGPSTATPTKPLQFHAPRNRTVGGEILQFSLTSDGYWAEAFAGHPVPPHIDDLFAIQDERRDALLFPLQNFNNHYEYHSVFQNVPHINFVGFDNVIGPILISITQDTFVGDSVTSPRQNSKSNLMQRQTSEKSIKGGVKHSHSQHFHTSHFQHSPTPFASAFTHDKSSPIAASTLAAPKGEAGNHSDSVGNLSSTPTASSMANLGSITPRNESSRGFRSGDKPMDRQLSSSAIHTIFSTDMLGSHRALIRTKMGDVVAKIPAMNTKRKYPKGHTLLNALIACAPVVPFDWDKVEFKEASYTKESIVSMELKLVPKHYKFGVIFARAGQLTDDEFLNNSEGSEAFDKFMSTIAKKIELKSWPGYPGGLDVSHGQTGKYSYFTKFRDYDIMFHVSTLLPHVTGDEQQLEKKRHIGNDVVVIVFQDDDTPVAPETIKSYFNHVFIIVHPIRPEEPPQTSSDPGASNSANTSPPSESGEIPSIGTPSSDLKSAEEEVNRLSNLGRDMPSPGHHRFSSESGAPRSPSRVDKDRPRALPGLSEENDFIGVHHSHSPSSPMLLQRLSEHASNLSPSRRSPIFSKTPRSDGSAASPPSSPSQSRAARVAGGVSPRTGSPIGRNESPNGTRLPTLRYHEIEGRNFNDSLAVTLLERHSDDSMESPDRHGVHLRSPRVMDARDSARSSDDETSLVFMDPVTLAAMPSGGQLSADWLTRNVVASPRESSDSLSAANDSSSSTAGRTASISSTGEFNLQSIDPATGEYIAHGISPMSDSHTHETSQDAASAVSQATHSDCQHQRDGSDESSGYNSASQANASETTDASGNAEPEDTAKRRLSRRLSTGLGNKQLVKSSKGRQLSKALPQITRAKLNVAAKERQANPPVQYRIEVVSKDGVVACDPKLPPQPVFSAGPYFREFILTKLINAERAAYFSKHFSKPIERTRELLFKELMDANNK